MKKNLMTQATKQARVERSKNISPVVLMAIGLLAADQAWALSHQTNDSAANTLAAHPYLKGLQAALVRAGQTPEQAQRLVQDALAVQSHAGAEKALSELFALLLAAQQAQITDLAHATNEPLQGQLVTDLLDALAQEILLNPQGIQLSDSAVQKSILLNSGLVDLSSVDQVVADVPRQSNAVAEALNTVRSVDAGQFKYGNDAISLWAQAPASGAITDASSSASTASAGAAESMAVMGAVGPAQLVAALLGLAVVSAGTSSTSVATVDSGDGGRIADGYINGATVFRDVDGDGIKDANEVSVTTSSTGAFTGLTGTGNVVAYGGTDIATGQSFEGVLTAPDGATVVNPLTTLVVSAVSSGLSVAAANSKVIQMLGLTGKVTDLASTDPLATVSENTFALQKAAAQVANVLVSITQALKSAGAASSNDAAASLLNTSLANVISGIGAGGSLDLTSASTIQSVLTNVASSVSDATVLSKLQAADDAIASVISSVNTAINTLSVTSGASATAITAALQQVVATQLVLMDTNSGALAAIKTASAGGSNAADALTNLADNYSQVSQIVAKSDDYADAVGDLFGTASSSAPNIIDIEFPRLNGTRSGTEVTVSYTSAKAGDVVKLFVDGGTTVAATATIVSAGSGTVTLTLPRPDGDGLHLISARIDSGVVAGASSLAKTIAVDTQVSVPTIAYADTGSSASDGLTSDHTLTVNALERGATFEYSTDAGVSWTDGAGNTFTVQDGVYSANQIQVRQTDAAGNTSSVAQLATAITVDTAAPTGSVSATLAATEDAAGAGSATLPVVASHFSAANMLALFDGRAATTGASPTLTMDLSAYTLSGAGTFDLTLSLHKAAMGASDLTLSLSDVHLEVGQDGKTLSLPAQPITGHLSLGGVGLGAYTFNNLDADQWVLSSSGQSVSPSLLLKLGNVFSRLSDGGAGDVLDLGALTVNQVSGALNGIGDVVAQSPLSSEQFGVVVGLIVNRLAEGRSVSDLLELARDLITVPSSLDTVGELIQLVQDRVSFPQISSLEFDSVLAFVESRNTSAADLLSRVAEVAGISPTDSLSQALDAIQTSFGGYAVSQLPEMLLAAASAVGVGSVSTTSLIDLGKDIIVFAIEQAVDRGVTIGDAITKLADAIVAYPSDLQNVLNGVDPVLLTKLLGDDPDLFGIIDQIREQGTVNLQDLIPLAARTLFTSSSSLNVQLSGLTGTLSLTDSSGSHVSEVSATLMVGDADTQSVSADLLTDGGQFTYVVPAFSDTVSSTLTYQALIGSVALTPPPSALHNVGSGPWLHFDPTTRTFSGTPTNADVGDTVVTLKVTDGAGNVTTQSITIAVANTNDAPTVANPIADQSATEDVALTFQVPSGAFADVDVGDVLTYQPATLADGSALPSWLSFNTTTRTFSGTPLNANVGAIDVKVTAKDSANVAASDVFRITTANVNDAPTVANLIADQSATEDTAFSFQVPINSFADVDVGDVLTYQAATLADGSALPSWLSFNTTSRTFTGTPSNAHVGAIDVKVTAKDSANVAVSDVFRITTANVNDAPTVLTPIADKTISVDRPFTYTFPADTFSDVDAGDTLTYSIANNPQIPGLSINSFNAATRTFSGTVTQIGNYDIQVKATDSGSAFVTDTFRLTVSTNQPPAVANLIPDRTATEDASFTYTVPADTFTDGDGDVLVYSATLANGSQLPSWLSFNPTTRVFSGTPTNDHVGTVSVTVTATDTASTTGSDTFTITVSNTNDAPTVVGSGVSDQSINEFTQASINVTSFFADVDANTTLTYTATGLPTGLTMSTAGVITGKAPSVSANTPSTVTVTASDGVATVSDQFVLTVANDTVAPTLTVSNVDISADTGVDSDFTTSVASQTITATLSAALTTGDKLFGSVNNGTSWTDVTSKVSGVGITWNAATLLSGSNSILFKVQDEAGNDGATTGSRTYQLDSTPPSVGITSGSENVSTGSFTYTFTFSEAVSNFIADDISVTNGAKGTFSSTSASLYTLVVTPDASNNGAPTNLTVSVNAGVAVDSLETPNTASNSYVRSVLYGTSTDNTLTGNDSAQLIRGEAGNDSIVAGGGADTIYGGEGADTISGGVGADVIYLSEASGAVDVLQFSAGDSAVGASDTIYGFASNDKIDLRSLLAAYSDGEVAPYLQIGSTTTTNSGKTLTAEITYFGSDLLGPHVLELLLTPPTGKVISAISLTTDPNLGELSLDKNSELTKIVGITTTSSALIKSGDTATIQLTFITAPTAGTTVKDVISSVVLDESLPMSYGLAANKPSMLVDNKYIIKYDTAAGATVGNNELHFYEELTDSDFSNISLRLDANPLAATTGSTTVVSLTMEALTKVAPDGVTTYPVTFDLTKTDFIF